MLQQLLVYIRSRAHMSSSDPSLQSKFPSQTLDSDRQEEYAYEEDKPRRKPPREHLISCILLHSVKHKS